MHAAMLHLVVATALMAAMSGGALAAQDFAAKTEALAKVATVDAAMVGDDGARTPEYRLYTEWRDAATVADLVAATAHASPVVRCYAARALASLEADADFVLILRGCAADVAKVTTRDGCSIAHQLAGDVMFEALMPRLDAERRLDIAELLVKTKSPLFARESVLRTLRFRDDMLHTIRTLAKDGDGPAVVALARWRLPSDVPVLQQHLRRPEPFDDNTQFLAAELFAEPRLLPDLTALAPAARARLTVDNAHRLRFWLQAIAAQRCEAAAKFLAGFVADAVPREWPRAQDLKQVLADVLASYADCAAFTALRAELPKPTSGR